MFWFSLVPVLAVFIFTFIYRLDLIYILVALFTPLSIDITNFGMNVGLALPSEPILGALLLVFILKLFNDSNFDRRIFTHPVSYSIYFYLIWMLITSVTSSDIGVSIKWFIAKLWLIIPTYFFGIIVFREIKNIPRFVWAYVIGFIPVVIFTISVHAAHGFSDHAAHWAMSPFFNDHTSYGAMLAMFIPIIFGFAVSSDKHSQNIRLFTFLAFVFLMIAVYFSISRAAWISIIGALGVFVMIKFKIKLSWVVSALVIVLAVAFSFRGQIIMNMEKNKQDSSDNFVEHVQSVSNIATDASNLERINRWNSALRLFADKPVFGWGPGTYQFVYAPYQSVADKTVISTNVGNKGTAHSEYLLILSEEGVLGLISFILIIILVVKMSIRISTQAKNDLARKYALLLFLGLTTYFAHALLNNFLDTDKAAVPFWGFIAAIVAIDLYHTNTPNELEGDKINNEIE